MSESKVKQKEPPALVFRHDQLVIVYDDLSPQAKDLCVLGSRTYASADDVKQFIELVDDFPRVINAIGRYQYNDPAVGQRGIDLLPVPLSQWLAAHSDQGQGQHPYQRMTINNTPLFVVFVQFFYWRQSGADDRVPHFMFSSLSVTRSILQQVERVHTAHVYNVRPLTYDGPLDVVHIGALCLSRWGIPSADERAIWPRFGALEKKLLNHPEPGEDPYEFPLNYQTTHVHLSTTRALADLPYRVTVVEDWVLRRIVGFALFGMTPVGVRRQEVWSNEAAALSSVVSNGLGEPGTAWSQFLVRGVYDPRLFLHIWHFLTGDTMPNLQRKGKRKADE